MTSYDVKCADAAATEAFGENLGRQLVGGEVIELIGDVGTGKTTLVRGLARGLDSPDHVSSPTFTVSKLYRGRLPLHHLDLYRLSEPGLIARQLAEVLEENPGSAVVVEWAGIAGNVLPEGRIVIEIEVASGDARKLTITIPKALEGLVV